MSERLEAWKAREKIRSHVGWLALWTGITGGFAVLGGLERIFADSTGLWRWLGVPLGVALLCCAHGLWNAKEWGRWFAILLCGSTVIRCVIAFARDLTDLGALLGVLLYLFVTVYLLLPSTGQRFERARGGRIES